MVDDLDARCSEACTRAGAFALLLGAIAVSLLSPLDSGNTRTALQNYISLRVALKEELDQISADPCWQKLSEQLGGMNATRSLTLTELFKYQCKEQSPPGSNTAPTLSVEASATTPQEQEYFAWDPPEPQEKKGLPPNPPRNFRLIREYPLPHLKAIVSTLTKLNDENLINAARQYSLKFDNAIYRWTMNLYRTRKKMLAAKGIMLIPISGLAPGNVSAEYLLALTVADIDELSNFLLPEAGTYDELRLAQPTIQTPGEPLQIQLEAGSVLLEIAILLTVIYFWIFYREARLSSSFPESGTLFAAFGRTRPSRIIFNLLIAVPGVCSVYLAIWLTLNSFTPNMKLTLVPAMLTICFTLAILKSSLSINMEFINKAMVRVFRRIKLIRSGFHRSENRS